MANATADFTATPDEAEIRALAAVPGMERFVRAQILLAQAIQSQEVRPGREEADQAFARLLASSSTEALIDLAERVDALERLVDGLHVTIGTLLAMDAARALPRSEDA